MYVFFSDIAAERAEFRKESWYPVRKNAKRNGKILFASYFLSPVYGFSAAA
jgi:hypothetical protein